VAAPEHAPSAFSRTSSSTPGLFFHLVLDGLSNGVFTDVTARREDSVRCSQAPRREVFVDADDFEVVAHGVRSPALEYGGPKTRV
jgi:hypothetical protein